MAGKYDRLDMIGSGTFGRAWLVRRRTTGKQYVMKEMRVAGLSERDRTQAATEVCLFIYLFSSSSTITTMTSVW